jgi:hypothetical protein
VESRADGVGGSDLEIVCVGELTVSPKVVDILWVEERGDGGGRTKKTIVTANQPTS